MMLNSLVRRARTARHDPAFADPHVACRAHYNARPFALSLTVIV